MIPPATDYSCKITELALLERFKKIQTWNPCCDYDCSFNYEAREAENSLVLAPLPMLLYAV